MKIFMLAPEVAPFVKVGGLADVVGALPKELQKQGHDVRIVCPLYGGVKRDNTFMAHDEPLGAVLGAEEYFCKVWETRLPGSEAIIYFLEHYEFYDRHEVYSGPWGEHKDNAQRFIFLCRAGLNLCYYLDWVPDLIHCHDWTTALVPVYLNTVEVDKPLGKAASIMTVHNLEHQGYCRAEMARFAGLPDQVMRPDCLESLGKINMLKGGLFNATKITTVSPAYAGEIQESSGGCGLNHVLKYRAADLIGIINGIDTHEWNPGSDPYLSVAYSCNDLSGKAACKSALQEKLGLHVAPDVPIFGVVSRLYGQKGLDLFAGIITRMLEQMNAQIVVLGTGDPALEDAFRALSVDHPGKVGSFIGFSNELAHQIMAGVDFYVMPSRFEPCGLSQMYAMIYGALPIVRATGGLIDTVEPYESGSGEGTGFVFDEPTGEALFQVIEQAFAIYKDQPEVFRALQQKGMQNDYSWKRSAAAFEKVYRWAVDARLAYVTARE